MIDVRRASSNTITNRYGASVSPWSTPVATWNESETPSSVVTQAVLLVYSTEIASTNSDGTPYFLSISNIVSLLMPSSVFLKSMKFITTGSWWLQASSIMRRSARIWPAVDRYSRNLIFRYSRKDQEERESQHYHN